MIELKKDANEPNLNSLVIGKHRFWFSHGSIIAYEGPEGNCRTSFYKTTLVLKHLTLLKAMKWVTVNEESDFILLMNRCIQSEVNKLSTDDYSIIIPDIFNDRQYTVIS